MSLKHFFFFHLIGAATNKALYLSGACIYINLYIYIYIIYMYICIHKNRMTIKKTQLCIKSFICFTKNVLLSILSAVTFC